MLFQKLSAFACALLALQASGQKNFQYSPEHPKPGDVITITYEPSGAIAGTTKPVEAFYFTMGGKNANADDIALKRKGNRYTGSFTTDTANSFVYLGFSADKKFDNNFNEGYYIVLSDGDKAKKGAYNNLAQFYQFSGEKAGVDRNQDKALEALQKELSLYPDERKTYLASYLKLMAA